MNKTALILFLVLVMIGGIYFLFRSPDAAVAPNKSVNITTDKNNVSISNFAFSPLILTVKIGETVSWTNQDSAIHNIVSDQSSLTQFSSDNLVKGQTYSLTFNNAGTYSYHCGLHSDMKGEIIAI